VLTNFLSTKEKYMKKLKLQLWQVHLCIGAAQAELLADSGYKVYVHQQKKVAQLVQRKL